MKKIGVQDLLHAMTPYLGRSLRSPGEVPEKSIPDDSPTQMVPFVYVLVRVINADVLQLSAALASVVTMIDTHRGDANQVIGDTILGLYRVPDDNPSWPEDLARLIAGLRAKGGLRVFVGGDVGLSQPFGYAGRYVCTAVGPAMMRDLGELRASDSELLTVSPDVLALLPNTTAE